MQMRLFLILALDVPGLAAAQVTAPVPNGSAPATLSLADALNLAVRNNPGHLSIVNNRRTADAAVRSANGQLLPNADASLTALRQQGGAQIVSGSALGASSDVYQSQYSVGIGYRINRATFIAPKLQRANRDAVEADINGDAQLLRANVTQQY